MVAEIAPLFIPGGFGGPELLIILFIAILLFGANKIPKLARSTGEAMGEFEKGKEKVETELEEMRKTGDFDGDEDDTDFVDTEPVTTDDDAATDVDAEPETGTETETETESN